tara:strand:+ start:184 stop:591 length:408 start_codon:yes stop_codon:yes gene_type:complete
MAFGNLKFDTLTTSDSKNTNTEKSVDTSYIYNGIPKAWNNINMVGTAAVRDSFNLSGFTDNGTGDFTVTVVSAMSDINYAHLEGGGQANTSQIAVMQQRSDHAPTTSSIRYQICFDDGDIYDAIFASISIIGESA